MQTIMIIGASRGIGLEFVRQYAKEGFNVIATCRSLEKAIELQALAKANTHIQIETLDITSEKQIQKLAEKIKTPIDLLLLSAGILGARLPLGEYTQKALLASFETNSVGLFLVAQAFKDHVIRSEGKQIAAMSSRMASIADNTSGGRYDYRASKAALNAMMKSLAFDLKEEGVHVSILHPGHVKTDMTNHQGLITKEESVKRLKRILAAKAEKETGLFHSHDGSLLPW